MIKKARYYETVEKGDYDKMKIRNRRVIFVIVILLVTVAAIILVSFVGVNREIRRFYNTFSVKLPRETSIIYKQSKFGALGDGESLIIYQASLEGIKEFLKQDKIKSWSELPIPEEVCKTLHRKIGLDSEELAKYMNLDWQEGLYIIMDRFKGYGRETDVLNNSDYNQFQNFTIGIIDLERNEIYLYKYNQ